MNSEITFTNIVIKQHTSFQIDSPAKQTNYDPDFGCKITCVISRNQTETKSEEPIKIVK
jgi:hypothetical protein